VERHPDASPDDPIQDEDLVDKGYETFEGVVQDLHDMQLRLDVASQNLRTTIVRNNELTWRVASNRNRIRDHSDSESSEVRFLNFNPND
jgi:hypothetical protein